MKKTNITILSIFFLFIIWLILGIIVDNSLLLPKPNEVFLAFIKIFNNLDSLKAIINTIFRLVIGLSIAFILGFLLAIVSSFNKSFAIFFNPFVVVLRTIPVISITIILLIMFGFTLTPYIITFLMIFPLIYQGIYGAITNIDKELIDVYKLEDNNFMSGIIHCYIPLISKDVRTVILQSLGLGIKVLVMAEYLAQTKNSIGQSLYLAKINLQFDIVFAWSLLLIIIALVFEMIFNHYKTIQEKIKKATKN